MAPGLCIHHHAHLEVLAERLATALDGERPPSVLSPQRVLVAHPGMGQWLRRFLSRRRVAGRPGIVANLETILLGEALQAAFASELGIAPNPLFDGQPLALAVFAELADPDELGEAARYLGKAADSSRRWQLAAALAAVYSRYLSYRPEWIADWEDGQSTHWQARLWRRLVARHGRDHRARLLSALLAKPAQPQSETLHCFGFSHLPPLALQWLARRAEAQPVALYFPNPCHEYWGLIESRRRIAARADGTDGSDPAHREIGHPLLASLGAQGQAFFNRLVELGLEQQEPDRSEAWPGSQRERGTLALLQSEIRSLAMPADPPPVTIDDSLTIVAAASRLRELEVLRERLLALLARDPSLKPGEIVVMAPNLSAYAALLPAVFATPEIAPILPYRLSDYALAGQHPVFGVCQRLLALSESRFGVNSVLAWLDCPALAQRFGLDQAAIAAIRGWLKDAGVAWGLDAAFRQAEQAGSEDRNTWSAGLARLWLGYASGDDQSLLNGRTSLAAAEGQRALWLAGLDGLITLLAAARRDLVRARPLSDWARWWQRLLAALFSADTDDSGATQALARAAALAVELAEAAELAGVHAPVDWAMWREWMRAALTQHRESAALPQGGVLFAGMVPFRALPFRVVALIGLNDGEYPRADAASPIDLSLAEPRADDRRLRDEDRYLFLESLLSARDALHLSYLGEDAQKGTPRPPAGPLAELIEHLQERLAPAPGQPGPVERSAIWWQRAPLHPFAARHAEASEPVLRSHGSGWHARPRQQPAPAAPATATSAAPSITRLKDLLAFYRHPGQFYFQRCLGAQLRRYDERLADDEVLSAGELRSRALAQQLLEEALVEGAIPERAPPLWRGRGGLPGGFAEQPAWDRLVEEVGATFATLQSDYAGLIALPPQSLDIDLALGAGRRLEGRIAGLRGDTLLRYQPGSCYPEQIIALFIEWAAASLAQGRALAAVQVPALRRSLVFGKPQTLGPALYWPDAPERLATALIRLIDIAEQGSRRCLPLPLATAWAWCERDPATTDQRRDYAHKQFGDIDLIVDDPHAGRRDCLDPYWQARFNDTPLFAEGSAEFTEFVALAEAIFALVTPQAAPA